MSGLPQRPTLDIFQEALFCTLASSTNLVSKMVPIEARQNFCKLSVFFLLKIDVFQAFINFNFVKIHVSLKNDQFLVAKTKKSL